MQYCYSREKRTLLNTSIFIPPAYWQSKQQKITAELPAQFGDAVKLNDELLRLKRLVEDLVAEATKKQIEDKGAFVKKAFSPTLNLNILDERINTVTKQEVAKKKQSRISTFSLTSIPKPRKEK